MICYSRKFFLARNYGEVIERTKEVHRELKTLGCFRAGSSNAIKLSKWHMLMYYSTCTIILSHAVDLTLDKDAEMDDDHLLIKIKVQELDRVPWRNSEMLEFLWKSCDMSTDDHNDARASWKCVVSNVLGRGESARLVLSKRRLPGLDGSLQFHSSRYNARRGWTSYTAELGSRRGEIAWRSLRCGGLRDSTTYLRDFLTNFFIAPPSATRPSRQRPTRFRGYDMNSQPRFLLGRWLLSKVDAMIWRLGK